ncbi:hypothetical protein SAMN05216207_103458 [Pseudonocardia ammonioxydans]|uniref:Uncharacterized protein n=1 Tax=Pseudonocardia ammonioxydans TaxID=260086 RepID=A0A1I5F233_PSUAM|nr:hypothetical protein [Pseudonocardia ammonioxydans]SFO17822.1 hypothetical protein SAMN05216207_103458 [Pseudonocardia ammonioxydans]
MEWRVGVLRSGAENVVWTDHGAGSDWQSARDDAVEALYERAVREGLGEYRIQVGEQEGYTWPGMTEASELDLSIIRDILPRQYWSA